MKARHILPVLFLVGVFGVAVAAGQEVLQGPIFNRPAVAGGQERLQEPIPNWAAPATWSPARSEEGLTTMAAVTSPLPFIGITPCRIVDTRPSQGFTGAYGPPILVANATRDFDLNSAPQCPSVPASAQAYSLNITVTETAGPGDVRIWPTGTAPLNVSTQNWAAANVTIANAAIVPAGTNGSVTVQVAGSNTHLIIDINGYYAPAGVGTSNTFLGLNAGNFTMTGDSNTGFGYFALSSNTTGFENTATGGFALFSNTTGFYNTATGYAALPFNTSGDANTATGGYALFSNTTGGDNTATGLEALENNTTGSVNTAIGSFALIQNTTGSLNIAMGFNAGSNLTTGNSNICIGNPGVAAESSTIRIGTAGTQTATFVAGINGTAVTGVPVLVSSSGQLGVASSSRYVKEDIREIAEESDGLMKLRPVAFRYTSQIDPTRLAQYGLIAEEVADVYPDLVVYDRDGRPETVRYQLVNALLLNEVQKQHRTAEAQERTREAQEKTIEQQGETIDHQDFEIERLKDRLSKLEARLTVRSSP